MNSFTKFPTNKKQSIIETDRHYTPSTIYNQSNSTNSTSWNIVSLPTNKKNEVEEKKNLINFHDYNEQNQIYDKNRINTLNEIGKDNTTSNRFFTNKNNNNFTIKSNLIENSPSNINQKFNNETNSQEKMIKNINNDCTKIKIVGFPPNTVFSICEILKKIGNITNYYYKNDSNYIVVQYFSPLEAKKAYNIINNNNEGIKAFYDNENHSMKPFNASLSERDLEYLFNSASIENSNYMLQGDNRIKIPQRDISTKIAINITMLLVFAIVVFLVNKLV